MRFARYVALELALAAALIFGVGFATGRVVSTGRGPRLPAAHQPYDATAVLPPHGEISSLPDFDIAFEPVGTFLGMSDELLMERARSTAIARAKINKGGSSISFRLDLADGSRAAFKPAQTNLQTIPRKEVGAYRINRLLGLNAVPPAATRRVSRDELVRALHPESLPSLPRIRAETLVDLGGLTNGVVSYWIPQIVDSGFDTPPGVELQTLWLAVGSPIPPEKRSMAAQLSNLAVFDFLIDNPDRDSGGNMKMSPDGERLYFMDNTMAFFLDPMAHEVNRKALLRTQRFSRRLWDALQNLTFEAIRDALAEDSENPYQVLTPSEIRAVVARRESVKRHVEGLLALHGPRNVLLFP